MNGIIITAIICTTVVLLVWLGGRNTKAEPPHDSGTSSHAPVWTKETTTRFGSNDKDGGK